VSERQTLLNLLAEEKAKLSLVEDAPVRKQARKIRMFAAILALCGIQLI